MDMSFNSITDNDNQITGFTEAEFDLINWGEPEDMVNFTNPNKIGHVVNKTNEKLIISKYYKEYLTRLLPE